MIARSLIRLSVAAALTFGFYDAGAAGETVSFKGELTADDVNVRADSAVSAQVLCVLPKGTGVEVISGSYDWYRIRLPQKAPAYIRKDMVACMDAAAPQAQAAGTEYDPLGQNTTPAQTKKACSNVKVVKSDVNVRLGPDQNSWIIGRVNEGEVLNVQDETGDWYKITPPDNSFGWVHKKFIVKQAVKPAAKPVSSTDAQDTLAQAQQTGSIMVTGYIQPYGKVFFRKASHKLVTDDNKVFLLQGQKSSLNALIGRKARVIGALVPHAKSKFPLIEVRSLEDVSDKDAQDQSSTQE